MINLIGADGKITLKEAERRQLDAISGGSIARETGSVPQEFTRIRSVDYHDGVFVFGLKPDPMDLRDHVTMTVSEAFRKIRALREMMRVIPLVDPKMASEMLVELVRKMQEAIDKDSEALQQAKKEIEREELVEKMQAIEDAKNGIIRFPPKRAEN